MNLRTSCSELNDNFMVVESTSAYTYKRIEEAIRYLEQHHLRQPELGEVADHVHLSPYHFQRLFSEWAGISPKRFLQYLTVSFLKSRLATSSSLLEAAASAGLSGQSRVYDLFTTLEAVTPQEYKQHGHGLEVRYGFHETPFGLALIGITGRGVCWLSFHPDDQDRKAAIESLQEHWFLARLTEDASAAETTIRQLFQRHSVGDRFHVLVKGTNFQVRVWEALLKLPEGAVTTYQDIARHIQQPKALQAVGSAVGANHIAYLIPCHRVIRKDGILGEYRWEPLRKKSMLGWEMSRTEAEIPG